MALLGCAGDLESGTEPATGALRPELAWHDGYSHRVIAKFADPTAVASGIAPLIALDDAVLAMVTADSADALDLRTLHASAPGDDPDAAFGAATELLARGDVEWVYLEPMGVPPPGDLAPRTRSFVDRQAYRGPAGIDSDYAAALGATGEGIRLLDVEFAWRPTHEDLVDRVIIAEPGQTPSPSSFEQGFDQHGTSVLGMTSAVANAYGVSGMVERAEVYTFPEHTVERGPRRVEAIAAAVAAARPGDVVLLEMQSVVLDNKQVMAEINPAVWQVVKAATDAGVVMVAAAGNGGVDLDGPKFAEYRARGDSGAILVGAGSSTTRARLAFSCFGSRVDLQGWGDNVTTLGYGDLFLGGGSADQAYTANFRGTSSAAPMVAAAAVAIQSWAKANLDRVLTPRELRDLLRETGRPQADPETGAIGPLPDLRAALARLQRELPTDPEVPGGLVINEVLADPPAGYDASGDGVASTSGDEFIELVNTATSALDLCGATISDAVGVRVTLPADLIVPPGGVLVVFGGGAVGARQPGVLYVSLGTLALNNGSDGVTVTGKTGTVLATMSFGAEGGRDQSLVRSPERDGTAPFVGHQSVAPAPASPGVRAGGRPL